MMLGLSSSQRQRVLGQGQIWGLAGSGASAHRPVGPVVRWLGRQRTAPIHRHPRISLGLRTHGTKAEQRVLGHQVRSRSRGWPRDHKLRPQLMADPLPDLRELQARDLRTGVRAPCSRPHLLLVGRVQTVEARGPLRPRAREETATTLRPRHHRRRTRRSRVHTIRAPGAGYQRAGATMFVGTLTARSA